MTTIAPILKQTTSQVCFNVDDVKIAQKRLPVTSTKLQLEKFFEQQLLAFSHDKTCSTIHNYGLYTHPLVHAVHTAFSEHRPLLLTPDIVWITLAQGFAQHINNHAETLRSRFVSHQAKQQLVVVTEQIPTQAQQWREAIQEWVLQIRDCVGADLYRLLECNFSTTTPITHTVSHVVMMDTFQKYFDYEMMCICGIPNITLEGTVEDWQSICDRVQSMTQYELGWWTQRILPICREFVETASSRPSLEFWQAIYKPQAIYGDQLITGWLADLFPYIRSDITQATALSRNPILKVERVNLTVKDGISSNSLPLGMSQVPLKINLPNGKNYALKLVAGFIGVAQNKNWSLQPEIGWAVLKAQSNTSMPIKEFK